ncbi:hypothetical protein [Methylobacterium sp. 37f]|uniref:hypothetical protein n=1 Tax=Methylobacterium sp. 37f TaxID=2817058 RepID=UPI001FFD9F97|nr:hypothetical protein [Methylobacterium sp. 37f]MCK2056114.1 hypothetical protein [Methylobacterium sp. 37f]
MLLVDQVDDQFGFVLDSPDTVLGVKIDAYRSWLQQFVGDVREIRREGFAIRIHDFLRGRILEFEEWPAAIPISRPASKQDVLSGSGRMK